MEDIALLGIVLLPLLGAIVIGVAGNRAPRKVVHGIACGAVAGAFLLALKCFFALRGLHEGADGPNAALDYTAYEWFSLTLSGKSVPIQVRFVMDALGAVMTLVVTGIGFLIHVYACGYMSEEKSYARFFAYLNLFTASMLVLVLGSSLPLMFVGWEGVGLCSYLLIGFWWENADYAAAGRKAFVTNRIGDFGALLGMLLLGTTVGSFEFADINAAAAQLARPLAIGGFELGAVTTAGAAAFLLFIACAGKSAQIPLFVWLPDAMAGPTPVSALIHAATMVTSGLYLVARLSPVFSASPMAMALIAVVGAATAFLAATIGCVQNQMKRVLAYSTVSQLGFMFAAAGCGAFAASMFHVYTHAFFKACLFLGAGSVMHAVGAHGDADVRELGGLARKLPRTHLTFLASCAAIAGVPLTSGFFSKDEILVGVLSAGDLFTFAPWLRWPIFATLFAAATMTAFYMFRLYFLTFHGSYRGGPKDAHHGHGDAHGHAEPHESPAVMTVPLIALATGAVLAGYVWVGVVHFQPWVNWLEPSIVSIGGEHGGAVLFTAMATGTAAMLVGIALAYSWYFKPGVETPRKLAAQYPGLHAFLMDKWRVDEFYEATVLAASRGFGLLCAGVDKVVVDGLVARASAASAQAVGYAASRLQNGLVHAYAAVMVGGLLVVVGWFVMPHADPEAEVQGRTVSLAADPGLGYAYRWDFDADGTPDTDWKPEPAASHEYADEQLEEGFVIAFESAAYGARLRYERLLPGEHWQPSVSELGARWQREDGDGTPPLFEVTEEGLRVRPNGARVRRGTARLAADESAVLARGEHLDVGQARVTVTGRATPTLHVRSPFGVERRRALSVSVPAVQERASVEVVGAGGVE